MSEPTATRNPWRPSIFTPKANGNRYQGVTTAYGGKCFEMVRHAIMHKHGLKSVSDGDVFEYMARWAVTLKGKHAIERADIRTD